MKKLKKVVCGFLLSASLLVPLNPACAADNNKSQIDVYEQNQIRSIVFVVGQNKYFINEQFPGTKMDVVPFIENDRTFVPVRFLGNAIGVDDNHITWDNEQHKAKLIKDSYTAEMTIGAKQIFANGVIKNIDVAPMLKNDRTFLPARYVVEALGYQVDWQDDRFVVIWPVGQPKPDITIVKQYVSQTDNSNSLYATISKNTGAVIENGLLIFYEKNNTSGQEAFFIQKSNKYDYLVSINSYSDESLNAVNETLKVYYPNEYGAVFKNLKSAINTGSEIKSLYFDNRYFGAKKFTDGTVIYVGSEGVKY